MGLLGAGSLVTHADSSPMARVWKVGYTCLFLCLSKHRSEQTAVSMFTHTGCSKPIAHLELRVQGVPADWDRGGCSEMGS